MASTDGTSGSTPATGTDAAKVRRPRAAAVQRAESAAAPTPETLAKDIEQTREDLAETLDAIAERVSPKRVAKRTSRKAAATVKENALVAKEAVVTGASAAKAAMVEAAETAKEKVTSSPESATPPLVDEPDATTALGIATLTPLPDALPPVSAVPVPELGTVRPGAATTAAPLRTSAPARTAPAAASPLIKKEYLLAGAVALAIALLVRQRLR